MNNMYKVMVTWIHKSFEDSSYKDKQTAEWPVCVLGTIPADFVNRTELCTQFSRKQILKAFAM